MARTPTLVVLGVAGSLLIAGCAAETSDSPRTTPSSTAGTSSTRSTPESSTTVSTSTTPTTATATPPTETGNETRTAATGETSTGRPGSTSTTARLTGTASPPSTRKPAPTRTYSCTDPETGTTRTCTRTEWRELQKRVERAKGPSLAQCRTPDTHEQYLQCVDKYSRSQTGDDPALPPNAVSPQLCWAWQNGDVDLTPAEQRYCRENEL